MKRKEKEHLKADPFVHFMERIIAFLRQNKRSMLVGFFIFLALAALLMAFLAIRSTTYARDNRLFTQALKIKSDTTLTLEEKVSRLQKLGGGRRLTSVTALYIAQSYYEDRQWQKAHDALKAFKTSAYGITNDNKRLLEAEILRAWGKTKESEEIIRAMLASTETEIAKDFLLLRLAKIKLADGQKEEARTLLKQLQSDFPESSLISEVQSLLGSLEEN